MADPGNRKGVQRPRTITRIMAKEITDCVKNNIEIEYSRILATQRYVAS